ncbi:MAG: transglycosylase domain-containing protein [Pseudobacteriovorax sp.]|nr:transglycosylase domain-containing protein [Pseudobacteriovorax sp.]
MIVRYKKLLGIGCLLIVIILTSLWLMIPPVWQLESGPISVVRWPKTGEEVFSVGPSEKRWFPIEKVSFHLVHAILVSEDARFYDHRGIDWVEVGESIELNLDERRFARGASTISQQVVKMAFLSSDKTIIRKIREILGTIILERILSKERILEWYLNLVPLGDGVYGISEAAEHYFDTSVELLTIQQSANLALVIPSPNAWSVGLRQKKLTDFGHERYHLIIQRMYEQSYITETLKRAALATGDFGRPVKVPE